MPRSLVGSRSTRRARVVVASVSPGRLTAADLDAIWAFFSRFVSRPRDAFERKLLSADEVTLARDALAGTICAFVGLKVYEGEWEGRTFGALCTLWTAIDPAYRGRNLLQRVGFRAFIHQKVAHPTRPLYWLFGASTYNSYLLLPHNFRTYWPRPGATLPLREEALLAQWMHELGEPAWDPATGVVRRHGVSRYREGVFADTPEALANPHVRFYAKTNPGQHEGDTLMCVCPLSGANWMALGTNVIRRGMGKAVR
jgi:hypothetical protein